MLFFKFQCSSRGPLKAGPFSVCSGLAGSGIAEVRRHFCESPGARLIYFESLDLVRCGSTCLVCLHLEHKEGIETDSLLYFIGSSIV